MKHILNIKGTIERYGLLMKDVAERMGVTASALSRKSNSIRTDTAIKLAEAIGCDLFELWDTYDDNGVLISPSELYAKNGGGGISENPSTKSINQTNESHQSDLFHQPEEENKEGEDNSHVWTEVAVGSVNKITIHKNKNIAGYGRCPKCGARFVIMLDE